MNQTYTNHFDIGKAIAKPFLDIWHVQVITRFGLDKYHYWRETGIGLAVLIVVIFIIWFWANFIR